MKIKVETTFDCNRKLLICTKPCPFGKDFKVGSFECVRECEFHKATDYDKHILDCSFGETNES